MNHSPITRIYPGQQTFSVTQAAAILGVHWTTVWRRAKSRPGQAEGIDIIKTPFGHRVTRAEIGRILGRPLDDADLSGLLFDDKKNAHRPAHPTKSLTSRRAPYDRCTLVKQEAGAGRRLQKNEGPGLRQPGPGLALAAAPARSAGGATPQKALPHYAAARAWPAA